MGKKCVIYGLNWETNPTYSLYKAKKGFVLSICCWKNRYSIHVHHYHKSVTDAGFKPDYQISKTRFGMTEP
jgi:hypothetical protein